MPATTHFRTCNLCEAMCGIAIEVADGQIASIRGDKADLFSRGHICPKAVALQDVHHDPDRLKTPLLRDGAGFRPISWAEAIDRTAGALHGIREAHGPAAVAFYQGNPTVHNYGSLLFGHFFSRALGRASRFSATSVDQLPAMLASYLMFGHQALIPVPDLDRTRHLLILGANPAASNGSLMSAPDVSHRLEAIRQGGGRVVLLDPRRTETARLAVEHHFIRPGTDALFLLAFLHTLFVENLAAPGRLLGFTNGLDLVRGFAAAFPPERVEGATGIPAGEIRRLARAFAAASPAVCYGRVGISTQAFGSLACWLVNVVNVVTGNLDRPGGAMFPLPAVDLVDLMARGGQKGSFARRKSRVRGLPEFGGEWPVAVLAEEIEAPGQGQIRALVTSAGNPVLSAPNGGRLDAALGKLEFMAAIDIYLNETTRHAHVILPPTFALEHDHYDLAFHALAIRNTAKYSEPLFAPEPGARHDWQIFLALASALDSRRGGVAALQGRLRDAVLGRLGPAGLLDLALRVGPYGDRFRPFGPGLSLSKLRREPHGIDLGPLQPALPGRLFTPDRRIDLAPAPLVADLARLEADLQVRLELATQAGQAGHGGQAGLPGGWLELIGRRDLRSNNSWMHNSERLVKGATRCTLRMNPADAAARGLESGCRVRVTSRVGSVVVKLEVHDDVMAGVVSLPHGWGHGRDGTRMAVAGRNPGASLNDLTDDAMVDETSGNAAFSGVRVEVEPA